jgi:hypothetical protein
VVVVEGTIDALAVAVAATKAGSAQSYCPVTQSGRELSDAQIRRILALQHAAPVLGFDADTAGLDSAFRYALAFAHDQRAAVVTRLPLGHDPASWLAQQGPAGLSVWSRHNHSSWDGPGPIPAATFAASYVIAREMPRAERMEALGRGARAWQNDRVPVVGPPRSAVRQDRGIPADSLCCTGRVCRSRLGRSQRLTPRM